ncbi:MAG TPA: hypothetical protein VNX18_00970 [Bryobacteraceae bacterium]|nr:hypothetical protein [Bryobacteraceae bacterium]
MAEDIKAAIERFLKASRQPVMMEAGDDPLPIAPATFALNDRGGSVTIECWDQTRNLSRRIRRVQLEKRGRLELEIERFGSRTGTLILIDLANPANRDADRRGARLKYREQFRRSLRRQLPEWRIVELSTEPDLHHSLSPSYPRAFLRRGSSGLAAIGAAEDALSPEGALSFGLIWLDYLRHRETRVTIEGLAIFVPAVAQVTTCHRVRHLNPNAARYLTYVHRHDQEDLVDPGDYTNFETRLDPCHQPAESEWVERIAAMDGVERREKADGSVSLAVRGLEFARTSGGEVLFGIDQKHVVRSQAHVLEITELAAGLARMRHAGAEDRLNPLYTRHPEAWLESQVRRSIEQLDAALFPTPVYGQVPQFAAGERGVIDLLAAGRDGRIAVIEVKANQDIHLPLQALDYWMRVKWHLDRAEFAGRGYFPGVALTSEAPKLLLVAPALEWHPSNEVVMKYFAPEIRAERIGVGIEWKQELRVMFRNSATPWQSPYSAR